VGDTGRDGGGHRTRAHLSLRAAVVAVLLCSTACGNGPGGFLRQPACMPPPYVITPDQVRAGGTVGIDAGEADCDPTYGDAAQVEVFVTTVDGGRILQELAPMTDAGGFSTEVVVPLGTPPGGYLVSAYPYDVDWCDDTGVNNRLSRAAGDGLVRASCAAAGLPLVVLP
jgi:hypothetical protein